MNSKRKRTDQNRQILLLVLKSGATFYAELKPASNSQREFIVHNSAARKYTVQYFESHCFC